MTPLQTYLQTIVRGAKQSLRLLETKVGIDRGTLSRMARGEGPADPQASTLARLVLIGLDPARALDLASSTKLEDGLHEGDPSVEQGNDDMATRAYEGTHQDRR